MSQLDLNVMQDELREMKKNLVEHFNKAHPEIEELKLLNENICPKCKSNLTIKIQSKKFREKLDPYWQRNYKVKIIIGERECPRCRWKAGFIKEERTFPTDCIHEPSDHFGLISPPYPNRVPPCFGHLCEHCGLLMVDCPYEIEIINKYLPYYWKYLDYTKILKHEYGYRPWKLFDTECDFCKGLNENGIFCHAPFKGLEVLKEKYPQEYEFYFGSEYSDFNLIRIIRDKWGWNNLENRKLIDDYLEPHRLILNNCFYKEGTNFYRDFYRLPKLGEKWYSEKVLLKYIKELFQNEVIFFHARPYWLKGQELDIFLPNLQIGIEYQGEQHFKPVEFFGGPDSFQKTLERDKKKKKKLCQDNNIRLIYFKFDEPLNKDYIRNRIKLVKSTT